VKKTRDSYKVEIRRLQDNNGDPKNYRNLKENTDIKGGKEVKCGTSSEVRRPLKPKKCKGNGWDFNCRGERNKKREGPAVVKHGI